MTELSSEIIPFRSEGDAARCPVCQRESEPDQKFCGICGSSLTATAEAPKHDRAFVGNNPVQIGGRCGAMSRLSARERTGPEVLWNLRLFPDSHCGSS